MMAGELDVDRLLRRMTTKRFREWEAYFELEPTTDTRLTYQLAHIAQVIANTMGRKPGQSAYKLEDFVLEWGKEEQKTSPEQMLAKMRLLAAMHADSVQAPEEKQPTSVEREQLKRARAAIAEAKT